MSDLAITPELSIPERELTVSFVRSSGPGGQNVNKVATKVELRWTPGASDALSGLSAGDRAWLLERLGPRLTGAGELVVTSSRTRDQVRNREFALAKLANLVREALARPTPRVSTRPSRGVRERRLDSKKRRGAVKRLRRDPDHDP